MARSVVGLFDHNGIKVKRTEGFPDAEKVFGPYRVDLLGEFGIDLQLVSPARTRIHRKIRDVLEHRTGLSLDLAARGLSRAVRADATLALLEDKAVVPAWFKRHGIPPYGKLPLAVISCWWAEELVSGDTAQRRKIQRTLQGIDKLYCFSQNQVAIFAEAGFPLEKVFPVSFGVDPDFYSPGEATKNFQVLSAGVDRGRDFGSLVDAAALLPEIRFDIFTQPGRIQENNLPTNVRLHHPVGMEEHRQNLRSASLVVIPTHELAYPTGQSILLEAMACGTCAAITETPAMREYIDDGNTNLAIPHADPEGIAKVIRSAMATPVERKAIALSAREVVVNRYSFSRMWKEIASSLLEKVPAG